MGRQVLKSNPNSNPNSRTDQLVLVAGILFLAMSASAAGGGAQGEAHGGISSAQLKTIVYQTINVTVIVMGMVYFLRKGIGAFLESRQKAYLEAKEKAFSALRKAEAEHNDIQQKLNKLQTSRTDTIARAQAEASELKNSIIQEAKQLSASIKREAEEASRIEVERAKTQIRDYMIQQAVVQANSNLKAGITEEDHRKLNINFISNIEAPHS